jgi:hypothetical protein
MRESGSSLVHAIVIVAAAASALGAGCGRERDGSAPGCPSTEGPAIDRPTMAFLSIARSLHHEADLHESGGDIAGATAALERLVAVPAPAAAEVDEVLADAHARLAELRLRRGDFEGAGRDVRAGLDHARAPTYFRGHLLEVEGLVEEARARMLADAGKPGEAQQARAKAMAVLEEAVEMQEQVIARALADGGNGD